MRKKLWSVLLTISLGVSALAPAFPAAAAPARAQEEMEPPYLYYPFDETEGDVAVNYGAGGEQWNAVKGGGSVEWEQGLIGGAAKLSDNGYLKIPDGVVEQTEDFTLSTWIFLDEQITNQTICTFATGTDQYLILTSQRGNAENGVSLVMTNGTDNPDKDNREQRISNTNQKERLSAGAWHQITFTLEGSVGNLYLDGELVQTKDDFSTNPSRLGHTADNYIGKPTWPDPHLKGLIDEFRLYNYALTKEQVHQISAQADEVLAAGDAAKLELGDLSQVVKDVKLPERGASGSKITWSSDDQVHLSDDGTIHRPAAGEGEAKVKLTASLEKGNAKASRAFEVIIPDMSLPKTDSDIFAMGNGNPTVPAYLADASFYYDENTKMFYAYGTNDGAGGNNVFPTQVWYSRDCRNWKNQDVELPAAWTDEMGTTAIWAPSITYNPKTGKYYLIYGLQCITFIAMADTPLGPWEDANGAAEGKRLFEGYDGQFFNDDDGNIYIVKDNGFFKMVKLKFDEQGKVWIDNEDPRFTKTAHEESIGTYHYAQVEGIRNMFEASYLYKRDGLYYLMWSFDGSENYNVRYAVSRELTGPYEQIGTSMDEPVLSRDDEKDILGPGHHSLFDYEGKTYIAYHRQHFPFVDSKRQTCIDELHFNEDGTIGKITPTHRGVTVVPDADGDSKVNLARGKQTKVFAARNYDHTYYRTSDISLRYGGNFAVDENNGTHWDAGVGVNRPWLIVDLGSESRIDEIETIFEFTNRTYQYQLEVLPESVAADLNEASASSQWQMFADRTKEGAPHSPVTDRTENDQPLQGRYVRLTITGARNLPETSHPDDMANAESGLSIFELKVFGKEGGDDTKRTLEAESYDDTYGMVIEQAETTGLGMSQAGNNDYLLYRDVDFGTGCSQFTAKVSSAVSGSRIEVHLDSMASDPAVVLEVPKTGEGQAWTVATAELSEELKGNHDLYLVAKGTPEEKELWKLDWFHFRTPYLDRTPLFDILEKAEPKLNGRYTKETLEVLKKAYEKGEKLQKDESADQALVYTAALEIKNALEGLVYQGGIQAEYFTLPAPEEGAKRGDPYTGSLEENNKKDVVTDANIDHNPMEDLLREHAGQDDNAGVRWTGRIEIPETGEYVFSTFTDNGLRFYLDGELLIDWWMNDWEQNQYAEPVHLEKGQICEFQYDYMELSGGSCAKWYWSINGRNRTIVPYDVLMMPEVQPVVTKLEAEDAVLTAPAKVTERGDSSGGKKVGFIDNESAAVTFTLKAPKDGTYRIDLAAGSGTDQLNPAHQYYVNGDKENAGLVHYEANGWDNWSLYPVYVELKKGKNTFTVTHAGLEKSFSELDYISFYSCNPKLEAVTVGGTDLEGFDQNISSYDVRVENLEELPQVDLRLSDETKEIMDVSVAQADKENPVAVITAQHKTDASYRLTYYIRFYDDRAFDSSIVNYGADPWVTYQDGFYYYCRINKKRQSICVSRSRELNRIAETEAYEVYLPAKGEPDQEVWAPELHFLDGKWYIYYTAGAGSAHRMYVLESKTADALGEYSWKGKLAPETDKWAIDQTIMEQDGKLYAIWSGWEGDVNVDQRIYIAEMANPWTITGERVELSKPEYPWETVGDPKINEGASVVKSPDGVVNIVYSASGSWTDEYCLGTLTLKAGADPMKAENWVKGTDTAFKKNGISTFSTGHPSFIKSPDGTEDYMIYHAARKAGQGWNGRGVRTQKFTWKEDGTPDFGAALNYDGKVNLPSGTEQVSRTRYEAEEGSLKGKAKTVRTDNSSAGKKVTGLTGTQDGVSITVSAECAGRYLLSVGAATGSEKAGFQISVNGGEPVMKTVLPFNVTPQEGLCEDNWMGYEAEVDLRAGRNVILLEKSQNLKGVDLDYLDVELLEKAQDPQEQLEEAVRRAEEARKAAEQAKKQAEEAQIEADKLAEQAKKDKEAAEEARKKAVEMQNAANGEAEEARKAAEAAREKAEQSAGEAQAAQEALEEARKAAEAAREAAGAAEFEKEALLEQLNGIKADAEEVKEETKKAREEAEKARKSAEEARKWAEEAKKALEALQARQNNAVKKGQKVTDQRLNYQVTSTKNKTVMVTGTTDRKAAGLTIPSSIKIQGVSYLVTAIGKKAFQKHRKLCRISIGEKVKTIGSRAFYRCGKLKTIRIKSVSLKSIGMQAFIGIAKKACVRVPEKKKKAYQKFLSKAKTPDDVKVK